MRRSERWVRLMAVVVAGLTVSAAAACDGGGSEPESSTVPTVTVPYKYVALGDSFASGEGAPPYESGPASCKRSNRSWSKRLDADSTDVASIQHRACSGAKTANLTAPWTDRGLDPQIPATPDPSITLVTLIIGGNDVGFGDIVGACVILLCPSPSNSGFAGKLTTLSNTLKDTVYPALKTAYPNAKLVHVGYPRLTPVRGTAPKGCGWLSKSDQTSAAGIVDKLNSTVKAAASTAGVSFVDITNAATGHELCTATSWFQAIGQPGQAHPTADGQKAIETVVAKALGISLSS